VVITLDPCPIISRIMAMAVSRDREYLADATGAELTRNRRPRSALQKIEGHERRRRTSRSARTVHCDPSGATST